MKILNSIESQFFQLKNQIDAFKIIIYFENFDFYSLSFHFSMMIPLVSNSFAYFTR